MTHDRYFLDNVAEWILELDRGHGVPWKGNYTSWLEQKQKKLDQEQKQESVAPSTAVYTPERKMACSKRIDISASWRWSVLSEKDQSLASCALAAACAALTSSAVAVCVPALLGSSARLT